MAAAPATVMGFPVRLSPEAIDRELSSMWKRRGGEGESAEGGRGVTRVTMGNVIWLGSTRHVANTRQVFSELVSTYPSRLFLLEYTGRGGDEAIRTYVNAYCYLQPDRRGQVCCEEIHLQFGEKALARVPRAVLPLLLPDIPTCFWYSSATPERYDEILPGLSEIADRTIGQIALLDNPAEGLRAMAAEGHATSFAWHRYAPVRERVAALFDDAAHLALLRRIDRVRIAWLGSENDVQGPITASLLGGWLASCLGWKPARGGEGSTFSFADPAGETVAVEIDRAGDLRSSGTSEIQRIELHARSGECFVLEALDDPGAMTTRLEDAHGECLLRPRILHADPLDEATALATALNSRVDSRFFREAATLAAPLLEHTLAHRKES